MKNKKKWTALMLAGAMGAASLIGCGTQKQQEAQNQEPKPQAESTGQEEASDAEKQEEAQESEVAEERPELNVMAYSWGMDMNEDPCKEMMEEVSGYQIKYYQLPAENADERLMLEIASGENYDMLYRIGSGVYGQLNGKNALLDIGPLLDQYGPDIRENVSDFAWEMVTDAETGAITAIPREGTSWEETDVSGAIVEGLCFRDDMLAELDADLPVTLDDFYQLMKLYKEKTGNAGYTRARGGWDKDILSAFGIGEASWYVKDGKMIPRVKMEGLADYVAFMQKLYQEGLMDNDMPINAAENATEKFVSGNALCTPLWFTAVTELADSIEMYAPGSKFLYATCLKKDENTPGFFSKGKGIVQVSAIPKNAAHPEDAIKWYNAISKDYKRIYIGEENVSYEVRDGKYYPIFPAFTEYMNSDKYSGSAKADDENKWWQARARKTDAMAEAYEQMNEHTKEYDYYVTYESYASGLPEMQEYSTALGTEIGDLLVKGIAGGTDAQAVVDEMIAAWDRDGGLACEEAMQKWYDEKKELIEN